MNFSTNQGVLGFLLIVLVILAIIYLIRRT